MRWCNYKHFKNYLQLTGPENRLVCFCFVTFIWFSHLAPHLKKTKAIINKNTRILFKKKYLKLWIRIQLQSDKKNLWRMHMWSLKSGEDGSNLVFTERAPVVFSGWRGSQQFSNFHQENILLWNCSMSYLTGLWLVEACSKLMTMKIPLNLCLAT